MSWEQSIQRTLFSPEEKKRYFGKFNVEGLLRGDYASRMSGYATARQNGCMSANDIRELENMDRIPAEEGGDLYLINGNMLPLKNAGAFADTPQDGVPAKSNDFVGRGGAREQAQFSHKAETELSGLCDDDGKEEKTDEEVLELEEPDGNELGDAGTDTGKNPVPERDHRRGKLV